MKTPATSLSATLLAALLSSSVALAQKKEDPPPPPPPGAPTSQVDEELRQTMQELMVLRMRKTLELSAEQEEKVVPLFTEVTTLRREHARKRMEGMRTLNILMTDPGAEDDLLAQRIEALDRDQDDFIETERRLTREIRSHLTVRQRAKLMGFEERFRSEMRTRFQEVREGGGAEYMERRRATPGRPRPLAPPAPPPPPPSERE
jgi:hypothetical protein